MSVLCQILYDKQGKPLYVLFEAGKFTTPLAILQPYEAELIYLSVKNEKDRQKMIGGSE